MPRKSSKPKPRAAAAKRRGSGRPSAARSGRTARSVGRPLFFAGPEGFRTWLQANHGEARELWVGFWRRGTGRPSMTWPESVDEALCFGWIDGRRQRIDESSYRIRFTPRQPASNWSAVNLKRIEELIAAGRVAPAGFAAFERRPTAGPAYSYEQRRTARLGPDFERRFRASPEAWSWYREQAPWYRRTAAFWVTSAKREATRERRFALLLECSGRGERLPALRRPTGSG